MMKKKTYLIERKTFHFHIIWFADEIYRVLIGANLQDKLKMNEK